MIEFTIILEPDPEGGFTVLVPAGGLNFSCDVVIGVSRDMKWPNTRIIHPTNNMTRKDIGRFLFMKFDERSMPTGRSHFKLTSGQT